MGTVVGVMPDGFRFPVESDIWVPLRLDPLERERGEGTSLEVSPDGQKLYGVIDNPYRITDNPTQQLRQDIQVVDLK